MSARWFALDVLFLSNPHVAHLGDKFGPAGPLAVIHLLGTAKIFDEDGRFTISYSNLARGAFLRGGAQAREIVSEATERSIFDIIEIDKEGFTGRFTEWKQWQRSGDPTGAERKRRQRAKSRPGHAHVTVDVTDMSRDMSRPHIQETKTEKTNSNVEPGGIDVVRDLFAYWQERCVHSTARLTNDRRGKVQARLREGYKPEQIRKAIDGAARAPFINEAGKRFDDIELICRTGSKLEGFISRADMPAKAQNVGGAISEGSCNDCGRETKLFQGRCLTCQEDWERRVLGEDGAA